MDDYYELLGVDTDAARDEIRAAYRERKDSLDGSTDAGKAEAAQLNKAWNVLSDPYQRGRYDERLTTDADDDGDDEVLTEVQSNGTSSTRAKKSAPPPRTRKGREMPPPTITPPDGTKFPQPKQRVIAMAIDLAIVLLMFVSIQFASTAYASAQKPEVTDRIDQLNTQIDQLNKDKDTADTALKDAKKGTDANATAAAQKKVDDLDQQIKDVTKEHDHEASKLNSYFFGGLSIAFILGFLYLAIPSALTGRTLGKRLQHLKVLRENGAPLGWSGAILRYGLLVAATMALYLLLRELAGVLVVVGVTTWLRNPNMQGLHDRWTHTIVVADA